METIKLSDLLNALLAFKNDANDDNLKKINEIKEKMVVKPYMNMGDKAIAVTMIISSMFNDARDAIESSREVCVNEVMYGLLSYVTNLENDLEIVGAFEVLYDCLCEFGIDEYILTFCKNDYVRLCDMVSRACNFTNLYKLMTTIGNFDKSSVEELTREIRESRKELTPEMLKSLQSIANAGSPEWQTFKETVGDAALNNVLWHDSRADDANDTGKKGN